MSIGSQYRETVTGGDETLVPEDHVAVTVAVGCCAKVRAVAGEHNIDQLFGIHQVGVGVSAAKIFFRFHVDQGIGCDAKPVFEDFFCIRPGNGVHGVEAQVKQAGVDQRMDTVKVKQLLHQVGIVGDRVDDFDPHVTEAGFSGGVQVDILCIQCPVLRDRPAPGIDSVGDFLRCRAAVGGVVLDAEITVRPGRVVTGGKDDTAKCLVLADDTGSRRRGQQATTPHQYLAKTVCRGHTQNDLCGMPVVKTSVAAQHQCRTGKIFQAVEDGLYKVFKIPRLLKYADFFAQAGRAGFLVGERRCLFNDNVHVVIHLVGKR